VRIGAYPGSFNPPTVAHLTIARAALEQAGLDRVDLILSTIALGKEQDDNLVAIEHRIEALERVAAKRAWLGVVVTDSQLLVDIAQGYDLLVVGADKWVQLLEPSWYGGRRERDEALTRLPPLAVAPRPPHPVPQPVDEHGLEAIVLDIDDGHHDVSATGVRSGRLEWLAPDAHHEPWQADQTKAEQEGS
jgi:nicotinamide-nucleotide adenylyltransferase